MRQAYDSFVPSFEADGQTPVAYDRVFSEARENLDSIAIQVVNSERQLESLLDDRGQLHLRNKLNVFIGGQILDRGLTIDHMIGFYYGRNPVRFQQDTVLQHSRMYGPRDRRDLPVTRFYTAPRIYQVMQRIHDMDSALRHQIETRGHEGGVIFIRRQGNAIVTCNPNKIRLSRLTTLAPGKRLIPVGFQTLPKTRLSREVSRIDRLIERFVPDGQDRVAVDIPLHDALSILNEISPTLVWEDEDAAFEWDLNAFLSAIEYLARDTGRVILFVRRGAQSARTRPGGRFQNSPETGLRETALAAARERAINRPMLVVLRHDGSEEQGWRGGPFWWPILYAPSLMHPVLYCADAYEDDENP